MAQDVVGRRDVKEELRRAECQQQRPPGEFSCRAVLEGEDDFVVCGGIDLRPRQALHEVDRRCDPQLEFGDIGLGRREGVRFAAGQQRTGNDRVTVGLADLTRQVVHVRIEPHLEQNRRIDVFRLGIGRCAVQQIREIAEIRHENVDRHFGE